MAGWKGISVDRIIAKLFNGKIGVQSKAFYTQSLALIDFTSDDDIPNLRAVRALAGSGGGGTTNQVIVSFTSASSITINWQADTPSGYPGTYAALLGNNPPKPIVTIPTGVTNENEQVPALIKYTTNGDVTQILTITIDWSIVYDAGKIIF